MVTRTGEGAPRVATESRPIPPGSVDLADFVGESMLLLGAGATVLLQLAERGVGHGVAEQTGYGSWVNWGEWQPGDLVYFAGTYRAGISHTGVYIGDGQFIHAENEGTGVVISSLYSDYYGGHYYGAYRHV
jgi:hypothetical protein